MTKSRPTTAGLGNSSPRYVLIAIMMAVIVYGSLYPFAFHDIGPLASAVEHLLGTWNLRPHGRGDTLANLLLYVPLGLVVALAAGQNRPKWLAIVTAVAVGAALSLAVELAQFYDRSRVSVLSDFYLNLAGTLGGAMLAGLVSLGWVKTAWPAGAVPAFARLLLMAWLGWRLFPYVPTIDLHKYWNSLKPLLLYPNSDPQSIFRYTVLWLSVTFLFRAGFKPNRTMSYLLPAMLAFFAAKIVIVSQAIGLPDLMGAGLALALAPILLRYPRACVPVLAVLMLAVIVMSRLLPWQWSETIRPFQWVPFFAVLHGSLQVNLMVLAEKFYLYGALILLLTTSGLGLRTAVLLQAAILLATSVLQMFMVSRSAEITDALLAVILGLIFALLRRQNPQSAVTAR
ncbi:MAG TPA: VanZ family protein [Rhizomicrobium sp.]|nr:VanZ family protein [Rhizomicrobium sp.]